MKPTSAPTGTTIARSVRLTARRTTGSERRSRRSVTLMKSGNANSGPNATIAAITWMATETS